MLKPVIRELKQQLSQTWNNTKVNNDNYPWSGNRRCLRSGCNMWALDGTSQGLAFCELHLRKAQQVLGWKREQFFVEQPENISA